MSSDPNDEATRPMSTMDVDRTRSVDRSIVDILNVVRDESSERRSRTQGNG
jgi:hypothetical protein